jgi:hypothetical protein
MTTTRLYKLKERYTNMFNIKNMENVGSTVFIHRIGDKQIYVSLSKRGVTFYRAGELNNVTMSWGELRYNFIDVCVDIKNGCYFGVTQFDKPTRQNKKLCLPTLVRNLKEDFDLTGDNNRVLSLFVVGLGLCSRLTINLRKFGNGILSYEFATKDLPNFINTKEYRKSIMLIAYLDDYAKMFKKGQ